MTSEEKTGSVDLTAGSGGDEKQNATRYRASVSASWQGPLPPPNLLRDYNEAFPGCAERIVAMAEAESRERHDENRHQRESVRLIVAGDVYSQKIGLWLAFILALVVIGIGGFLIYTGKLAWGTGLISIPLLTLVSLFIYGRKQQSDELGKINPSDDNDSEQTSLPFPK